MEALTLTRRRVPAPWGARRGMAGLAFLGAFGLVAVGVGAGRAITTSFLPVLLDRVAHSPGLIGVVMLVNPIAGFAVPLIVGLWSDRRGGGRLGRRLPFVVGGTLLTSGGLVAVALGTADSYLTLALAGALVYVGLNATTTAHRAIVVEGFEDGERPAATSAQEVAILAGGLVGVVAGGLLIDASATALFVAAALALPLLAVPTVVSLARRGRVAGARQPTPGLPRPRARDLVALMRRRGAAEVLLAQLLWVMAYVSLPTFFVLYARDVLSLGAGPASLLLAAFGLLTGAGMLAAGRTPPERVYPRLLLGAALLGGGLVAAAPFDSLALAAGPFAAAALGFGLVTSLGFPYFARFIPEGRSGSFSGLFFSGRAIAAAVSLPLSGLLIAATGSYRALLLQGAAALLALVPLARAGRSEASARAAAPLHPRPRRVGAVIPCYGRGPLDRVVTETLEHVQEVVLVDDGSPPEQASLIDLVASRPGVRVLRLPANAGKGDAVAAGAALLLQGPERPDAVLVIDSDGQHPPDAIPAFLERARYADVVIGDRRADRRAMPWVRRATNLISSSLLSAVVRRRLPDSQCGMRLHRVEALERVPLPAGRYEAETSHLKAAVRAELGVTWVPIPAIYEGAHSSFRPLADTARVLGAIFTRAKPPERRRRTTRPEPGFLRAWSLRLAGLVAGTMTLGALVPLLGPIDETMFLRINALGDGPEWLYQALDPHTRNYIVLSLLAVAAASLARSPRALGTAVAVIVAAFFSDLLLQSVYLLYDRPRPEEILSGEVLLTHGRSWAHIASFPSGHMAVTTAIAVAGMAAVPALRGPLWVYVGAIAVTRVAFGAHFPLDVAAGLVFGYEIGRFSAALAHSVGLLREPPASPLPPLRPLRERPLEQAVRG